MPLADGVRYDVIVTVEHGEIKWKESIPVLLLGPVKLYRLKFTHARREPQAQRPVRVWLLLCPSFPRRQPAEGPDQAARRESRGASLPVLLSLSRPRNGACSDNLNYQEPARR